MRNPKSPTVALASMDLPRAARSGQSHHATIVPIVDRLSYAILFQPVTLLNFTLEEFSSAGDLIEIIIGEQAPLFLNPPFDLLPVSFHAVPIH